MMLHELMSKNGTNDDWWQTYYRYYKDDLNATTTIDKKIRRKPTRLDLNLKSKRRKQHKIQTNSVLENNTFDISTSKTMTSTVATAAPAITTTTAFPSTTFFKVDTTTAAITKSTNELESSNRQQNTTSEIDSKTQIDGRMSLNETTTGKNDDIPTTTTPSPATATTEHSITYNVTADNPKGVRIVNKAKGIKMSNAVWGKWQKWTKCSRSCGGGVMSQSRQCVSR